MHLIGSATTARATYHITGIQKEFDVTSPSDELETRDAWWLEVRSEVRSHMRAMLSLATPSPLAYGEHSVW